MPASPGPAVKKRLRTPKKSLSAATLDLAEAKESSSSWAGLEIVKGRTASAMDRVEFLASSTNLMTEFRAREARDFNLHLRHTTLPGGRQHLALSESLKKSKSEAAMVLEGQKERLTKGNTLVKRADALTKFVAHHEVQKSGKLGGDAAKTSAKGTTFQMLKPYPLYEELYGNLGRSKGRPRESPMLAVSIRMPYNLPDEVRYHGVPKKLQRTRRSEEARSGDEEDEEDD